MFWLVLILGLPTVLAYIRRFRVQHHLPVTSDGIQLSLRDCDLDLATAATNGTSAELFVDMSGLAQFEVPSLLTWAVDSATAVLRQLSPSFAVGTVRTDGASAVVIGVSPSSPCQATLAVPANYMGPLVVTHSSTTTLYDKAAFRVRDSEHSVGPFHASALTVLAADALDLALVKPAVFGPISITAQRGIVSLHNVSAAYSIQVDIGSSLDSLCAAGAAAALQAAQNASAATNATAGGNSTAAVGGSGLPAPCTRRGGEVYVMLDSGSVPLGSAVYLNASEPTGAVCAVAPALQTVVPGMCTLSSAAAASGGTSAASDTSRQELVAAAVPTHACSTGILLCPGVQGASNYTCATSPASAGSLNLAARGGVYVYLPKVGATLAQAQTAQVQGVASSADATEELAAGRRLHMNATAGTNSSALVSGALAMATAGGFAGGSSLDTSSLRALAAVPAWVRSLTSADALVRIDLRQQGAGQWFWTTRPVYLQLEPHWVAAFSAGLLLPATRTLQSRFSPGLCPGSALGGGVAAIVRQGVAPVSLSEDDLSSVASAIRAAVFADPAIQATDDDFRLSLVARQTPEGGFRSYSVDENGVVSAASLQASDNGALIVAIVLSLIIVLGLGAVSVALLLVGNNIANSQFSAYLTRQSRMQDLEDLHGEAAGGKGPGKAGTSTEPDVAGPPVKAPWGVYDIATYIGWMAAPHLRDAASEFIRFKYHTPREEAPRLKTLWALLTFSPIGYGLDHKPRTKIVADLLMCRRPTRRDTSELLLKNEIPLEVVSEELAAYCSTYGMKALPLTSKKVRNMLSTTFGVTVVDNVIAVLTPCRWKTAAEQRAAEAAASADLFTDDALGFFMMRFVTNTGLELDTIPLEEFQRRYREFCRQHGLVASMLTTTELESRQLAVNTSYRLHVLQGLWDREDWEEQFPPPDPTRMLSSLNPLGSSMLLSMSTASTTAKLSSLKKSRWCSLCRRSPKQKPQADPDTGLLPGDTSEVAALSVALNDSTLRGAPEPAASTQKVPCCNGCCSVRVNPAREMLLEVQGGCLARSLAKWRLKRWRKAAARRRSGHTAEEFALSWPILAISALSQVLIVLVPPIPIIALVLYMQSVYVATTGTGYEGVLLTLDDMLYTPWLVFNRKTLDVNTGVLIVFGALFVALALLELVMYTLHVPVIRLNATGERLLGGVPLGTQNGLTIQQAEAHLASMPDKFPVTLVQPKRKDRGNRGGLSILDLDSDSAPGSDSDDEAHEGGMAPGNAAAAASKAIHDQIAKAAAPPGAAVSSSAGSSSSDCESSDSHGRLSSSEYSSDEEGHIHSGFGSAQLSMAHLPSARSLAVSEHGKRRAARRDRALRRAALAEGTDPGASRAAQPQTEQALPAAVLAALGAAPPGAAAGSQSTSSKSANAFMSMFDTSRAMKMATSRLDRIDHTTRMVISSVAALRAPDTVAFIEAATEARPVYVERPYSRCNLFWLKLRWLLHALLQLWLVLVLGGIVAYLLLLFIFWVLGAMVSPAKYLPLATAAITFVVLLSTYTAKLAAARATVQAFMREKVAETLQASMASSPLLAQVKDARDQAADALENNDMQSLVENLAHDGAHAALAAVLKAAAARTGIDLATQLALVRGELSDEELAELAETKLRIDPALAGLIIAFARGDSAAMQRCLPSMVAHLLAEKDEAQVQRLAALASSVLEFMTAEESSRLRMLSTMISQVLEAAPPSVPITPEIRNLIDLMARTLAQPSSTQAALGLLERLSGELASFGELVVELLKLRHKPPRQLLTNPAVHSAVIKVLMHVSGEVLHRRMSNPADANAALSSLHAVLEGVAACVQGNTDVATKRLSKFLEAQLNIPAAILPVLMSLADPRRSHENLRVAAWGLNRLLEDKVSQLAGAAPLPKLVTDLPLLLLALTTPTAVRPDAVALRLLRVKQGLAAMTGAVASAATMGISEGAGSGMSAAMRAAQAAALTAMPADVGMEVPGLPAGLQAMATAPLVPDAAGPTHKGASLADDEEPPLPPQGMLLTIASLGARLQAVQTLMKQVPLPRDWVQERSLYQEAALVKLSARKCLVSALPPNAAAAQASVFTLNQVLGLRVPLVLQLVRMTLIPAGSAAPLAEFLAACAGATTGEPVRANARRAKAASGGGGGSSSGSVPKPFKRQGGAMGLLEPLEERAVLRAQERGTTFSSPVVLAYTELLQGVIVGKGIAGDGTPSLLDPRTGLYPLLANAAYIASLSSDNSTARFESKLPRLRRAEEAQLQAWRTKLLAGSAAPSPLLDGAAAYQLLQEHTDVESELFLANSFLQRLMLRYMQLLLLKEVYVENRQAWPALAAPLQALVGSRAAVPAQGTGFNEGDAERASGSRNFLGVAADAARVAKVLRLALQAANQLVSERGADGLEPSVAAAAEAWSVPGWATDREDRAASASAAPGGSLLATDISGHAPSAVPLRPGQVPLVPTGGAGIPAPPTLRGQAQDAPYSIEFIMAETARWFELEMDGKLENAMLHIATHAALGHFEAVAAIVGATTSSLYVTAERDPAVLGGLEAIAWASCRGRARAVSNAIASESLVWSPRDAQPGGKPGSKAQEDTLDTAPVLGIPLHVYQAIGGYIGAAGIAEEVGLALELLFGNASMVYDPVWLLRSGVTQDLATAYSKALARQCAIARDARSALARTMQALLPIAAELLPGAGADIEVHAVPESTASEQLLQGGVTVPSLQQAMAQFQSVKRTAASGARAARGLLTDSGSCSSSDTSSEDSSYEDADMRARLLDCLPEDADGTQRRVAGLPIPRASTRVRLNILEDAYSSDTDLTAADRERLASGRVDALVSAASSNLMRNMTSLRSPFGRAAHAILRGPAASLGQLVLNCHGMMTALMSAPDAPPSQARIIAVTAHAVQARAPLTTRQSAAMRKLAGALSAAAPLFGRALGGPDLFRGSAAVLATHAAIGTLHSDSVRTVLARARRDLGAGAAGTAVPTAHAQMAQVVHGLRVVLPLIIAGVAPLSSSAESAAAAALSSMQSEASAAAASLLVARSLLKSPLVVVHSLGQQLIQLMVDAGVLPSGLLTSGASRPHASKSLPQQEAERAAMASASEAIMQLTLASAGAQLVRGAHARARSSAVHPAQPGTGAMDAAAAEDAETSQLLMQDHVESAAGVHNVQSPSMLAAAARDNTLNSVSERMNRVLQALLLKSSPARHLPGTFSMYFMLLVSAVSGDARAQQLAALRLGTKLGIKETAALIGVSTGALKYAPRIRALAVQLNLKPKLAQGLVGLATGTQAMLALGASTLAHAFGFQDENLMSALVRVMHSDLSDLSALAPLAASLDVPASVLTGVLASADPAQFSSVLRRTTFLDQLGISQQYAPIVHAAAQVAHGHIPSVQGLLADDPAGDDLVTALRLMQSTDVYAFTRYLQQLTALPSFPRPASQRTAAEDGGPGQERLLIADLALGMLSGSGIGAMSIPLLVDTSEKLGVPVHHLLALLIDVLLQQVRPMPRERGSTDPYNGLLDARNGVHFVAVLASRVPENVQSSLFSSGGVDSGPGGSGEIGAAGGRSALGPALTDAIIGGPSVPELVQASAAQLQSEPAAARTEHGSRRGSSPAAAGLRRRASTFSAKPDGLAATVAGAAPSVNLLRASASADAEAGAQPSSVMSSSGVLAPTLQEMLGDSSILGQTRDEIISELQNWRDRIVQALQEERVRLKNHLAEVLKDLHLQRVQARKAKARALAQASSGSSADELGTATLRFVGAVDTVAKMNALARRRASARTSGAAAAGSPTSSAALSTLRPSTAVERSNRARSEGGHAAPRAAVRADSGAEEPAGDEALDENDVSYVWDLVAQQRRRAQLMKIAQAKMKTGSLPDDERGVSASGSKRGAVRVKELARLSKLQQGLDDAELHYVRCSAAAQEAAQQLQQAFAALEAATGRVQQLSADSSTPRATLQEAQQAARAAEHALSKAQQAAQQTEGKQSAAKVEVDATQGKLQSWQAKLERRRATEQVREAAAQEAKAAVQSKAKAARERRKQAALNAASARAQATLERRRARRSTAVRSKAVADDSDAQAALQDLFHSSDFASDARSDNARGRKSSSTGGSASRPSAAGPAHSDGRGPSLAAPAEPTGMPVAGTHSTHSEGQEPEVLLASPLPRMPKTLAVPVPGAEPEFVPERPAWAGRISTAHHPMVSSVLALLKICLGYPLRRSELPWVVTGTAEQANGDFASSRGPLMNSLRRYALLRLAAPVLEGVPLPLADASVEGPVVALRTAARQFRASVQRIKLEARAAQASSARQNSMRAAIQLLHAAVDATPVLAVATGGPSASTAQFDVASSMSSALDPGLMSKAARRQMDKHINLPPGMNWDSWPRTAADAVPATWVDNARDKLESAAQLASRARDAAAKAAKVARSASDRLGGFMDSMEDRLNAVAGAAAERALRQFKQSTLVRLAGERIDALLESAAAQAGTLDTVVPTVQEQTAGVQAALAQPGVDVLEQASHALASSSRAADMKYTKLRAQGVTIERMKQMRSRVADALADGSTAAQRSSAAASVVQWAVEHSVIERAELQGVAQQAAAAGLALQAGASRAADHSMSALASAYSVLPSSDDSHHGAAGGAGPARRRAVGQQRGAVSDVSSWLSGDSWLGGKARMGALAWHAARRAAGLATRLAMEDSDGVDSSCSSGDSDAERALGVRSASDSDSDSVGSGAGSESSSEDEAEPRAQAALLLDQLKQWDATGAMPAQLEAALLSLLVSNTLSVPSAMAESLTRVVLLNKPLCRAAFAGEEAAKGLAIPETSASALASVHLLAHVSSVAQADAVAGFDGSVAAIAAVLQMSADKLRVFLRLCLGDVGAADTAARSLFNAKPSSVRLFLAAAMPSSALQFKGMTKDQALQRRLLVGSLRGQRYDLFRMGMLLLLGDANCAAPTPRRVAKPAALRRVAADKSMRRASELAAAGRSAAAVGAGASAKPGPKVSPRAGAGPSGSGKLIDDSSRGTATSNPLASAAMQQYASNAAEPEADAARELIETLLRGRQSLASANFERLASFCRRKYPRLLIQLHQRAPDAQSNLARARLELYMLDTFLKVFTLLAGDGGDVGSAEFFDAGVLDAVAPPAPGSSSKSEAAGQLPGDDKITVPVSRGVMCVRGTLVGQGLGIGFGSPSIASALVASPVVRGRSRSFASGVSSSSGDVSAGRSSILEATSTAFLQVDLPELLARLGLQATAGMVRASVMLRDARVLDAVEAMLPVLCPTLDNPLLHSELWAGPSASQPVLGLSDAAAGPRRAGLHMAVHALAVMHASLGRTLDASATSLWRNCALSSSLVLRSPQPEAVMHVLRQAAGGLPALAASIVATSGGAVPAAALPLPEAMAVTAATVPLTSSSDGVLLPGLTALWQSSDALPDLVGAMHGVMNLGLPPVQLRAGLSQGANVPLHRAVLPSEPAPGTAAFPELCIPFSDVFDSASVLAQVHGTGSGLRRWDVERGHALPAQVARYLLQSAMGAAAMLELRREAKAGAGPAAGLPRAERAALAAAAASGLVARAAAASAAFPVYRPMHRFGPLVVEQSSMVLVSLLQPDIPKGGLQAAMKQPQIRQRLAAVALVMALAAMVKLGSRLSLPSVPGKGTWAALKRFTATRFKRESKKDRGSSASSDSDESGASSAGSPGDSDSAASSASSTRHARSPRTSASGEGASALRWDAPLRAAQRKLAQLDAAAQRMSDQALQQLGNISSSGDGGAGAGFSDERRAELAALVKREMQAATAHLMAGASSVLSKWDSAVRSAHSASAAAAAAMRPACGSGLMSMLSRNSKGGRPSVNDQHGSISRGAAMVDVGAAIGLLTALMSQRLAEWRAEQRKPSPYDDVDWAALKKDARGIARAGQSAAAAGQAAAAGDVASLVKPPTPDQLMRAMVSLFAGRVDGALEAFLPCVDPQLVAAGKAVVQLGKLLVASKKWLNTGLGAHPLHAIRAGHLQTLDNHFRSKPSDYNEIARALAGAAGDDVLRRAPEILRGVRGLFALLNGDILSALAALFDLPRVWLSSNMVELALLHHRPNQRAVLLQAIHATPAALRARVLQQIQEDKGAAYAATVSAALGGVRAGLEAAGESLQAIASGADVDAAAAAKDLRNGAAGAKALQGIANTESMYGVSMVMGRALGGQASALLSAGMMAAEDSAEFFKMHLGDRRLLAATFGGILIRGDRRELIRTLPLLLQALVADEPALVAAVGVAQHLVTMAVVRLEAKKSRTLGMESAGASSEGGFSASSEPGAGDPSDTGGLADDGSDQSTWVMPSMPPVAKLQAVAARGRAVIALLQEILPEEHRSAIALVDAVMMLSCGDPSGLRVLAVHFGGYSQQRVETVIALVSRLSAFVKEQGSLSGAADAAKAAAAAAADSARAAATSAVTSAVSDAKQAVKAQEANLVAKFTKLPIVDGRLSPEGLDILFGQFDQDASGSLDFREFRELLRHCNLDLSRERAKRLFVELDHSTGNYQLDKPEFREGMVRLQDELTEAAMSSVGLSRHAVIRGTIGVAIALLLVIGFMLAAAGALTGGGAFSAVVNSALPMTGGLSFASMTDSGQKAVKAVKERAGMLAGKVKAVIAAVSKQQ